MIPATDWQQILVGKRIAVLGFSKDHALTIREALENTNALCRITNESMTPADIQAFDILVIRKSNDRLELAGEFSRPRVIVGEYADVASDLSAISSAKCHFMILPGSPEELILRVATALVMTDAAAPAPKKAPAVLLADDDPSITALLKATLSRQSITCFVAQDGERALALAREHQPAVVVLDVNMPHTDGFEVLAALRNDPLMRDTKVLMLTGCEQETDVVRGFGLGTDDYVTKPFNPMEVTARIKRLLVTCS